MPIRKPFSSILRIVDVPQLNVVLSDSRREQFEVVTLAISVVSLNAVAVHPNSLFAAKLCRVSLKKSRNLAF